MTDRTETTATYTHAEAVALANQGYTDGLREAAQMLELSASEIRLAAGEMTAQEMRSVKAVLAWRSRAILEKANG